MPAYSFGANLYCEDCGQFYLSHLISVYIFGVYIIQLSSSLFSMPKRTFYNDKTHFFYALNTRNSLLLHNKKDNVLMKVFCGFCIVHVNAWEQCLSISFELQMLVLL